MQCADIFGKEKLAACIFSGHIVNLFIGKTFRVLWSKCNFTYFFYLQGKIGFLSFFSGHIEDLFLSKTCRSQYANDEKATSQNILPNCGEYKGV